MHILGAVRVVCTDRDTHPSRELAPPMEIHDDPEWRAILHAADELSAEEAEWLYQAERAMHWTHRAKRGGDVKAAKVHIGQTQRGDVEIGDPGDGQGFLWRFRCPTCRRDLPLRTNRLNRILMGHMKAGLPSFDISMRPEILRRLEQMS